MAIAHSNTLPHRKVASAIATMHASRTNPAVKLAFELLVLTAARSGEIRGRCGPRWTPRPACWTIPAERMKMKRGHRVPLCGRAIEILDVVRALRAGPLVFAREGGKALDEKRMLRVLQWHRVAAVPHGFRSSLRDWAAEETDHPREVIEAALAHVLRDRVEAAYARSDLFEGRHLMDDWEAAPDHAASAVMSDAHQSRDSPSGSGIWSPRYFPKSSLIRHAGCCALKTRHAAASSPHVAPGNCLPPPRWKSQFRKCVSESFSNCLEVLLGKVPTSINRSQETLVASKNNPDYRTEIGGAGDDSVGELVGAPAMMPRDNQDMRPITA